MQSFNVQEAAQKTGLSPHTLRYYERIGLLETERDPNGYRRYSQGDLGWLRVLQCLRDTGMSIHTMQRYAQLVQEKAPPKRMLELLEAHRDEVLANLERQQEYLKVIERKIAVYQERGRLG
ncbi:MAG: MerR family transcriptional regulator [Thermaceae bacterium]|nr:MerR family transcriptional regulator [Thermaceae bacterium]